MICKRLDRLFMCIGKIEDLFLAEAKAMPETVAPDIIQIKSARRKRIVKYSAYGAAGLAVSVGIVAICLKVRSNRLAKAA